MLFRGKWSERVNGQRLCPSCCKKVADIHGSPLFSLGSLSIVRLPIGFSVGCSVLARRHGDAETKQTTHSGSQQLLVAQKVNFPINPLIPL